MIQCSGLQPCTACSSRSTQCTYADIPRGRIRIHARQQNHGRNLQSTQAHGHLHPLASPQLPLLQNQDSNLPPRTPQFRNERHIPTEGQVTSSKILAPMNEASAATGDAMESTSVGISEGQSLREQLRMLQDGKGRLRG